jgi:hypothetical protein
VGLCLTAGVARGLDRLPADEPRDEWNRTEDSTKADSMNRTGAKEREAFINQTNERLKTWDQRIADLKDQRDRELAGSPSFIRLDGEVGDLQNRVRDVRDTLRELRSAPASVEADYRARIYADLALMDSALRPAQPAE